MTRLVRIAALSCVAGAILTSAALANVPDPSKSTLGINLPAVGPARSYIAVGGATAGVADACTEVPTPRCMDYTVEIRDFSNNPIAGSSVVVDFLACTPASGGDTQISCDQLNANTGQAYISPSKVSGSTAANGRFTFKVQGASNSTTGSLVSPNQSDGIQATPVADPPCAKVYADGVLIGSLFAVHYDINGGGSPTAAVTSADASATLNEVNRGNLNNIHYRRTDMNVSNTFSTADASLNLSMALDQGLGSGSKNTGGPVYCP